MSTSTYLIFIIDKLISFFVTISFIKLIVDYMFGNLFIRIISSAVKSAKLYQNSKVVLPVSPIFSV